MRPVADDCFALPAGVRWTPVAEALALLRSRLHPLTDTEDLPLAAADGRILATDLRALRANPPADNAAVDGYGFAFAALPDAEEITLPLCAGVAAAGHAFAGAVPAGWAMRVLTGAILPAGVDTVLMQEDVTVGPGHITFRRSRNLRPGVNRRRAAEDAAADEVILTAGTRLTPQALARAAVVGGQRVTVYRSLRVAVMSTGDELQATPPVTEAQVFDANRPMLAALVARWGVRVVDLGIITDDPALLRAALDRAAAQADVIITSGGASGGDADHLSQILRADGAMSLWRIAMKPGRPLALGVWQGRPVFGLPGNPVASLVTALVFVRPALLRLAGAHWTEPRGYTLPSGFAYERKPGRREYLRVKLGADGRLQKFRSEGSGLVGGLVWADGLADIPDAAGSIAIGDPLHFVPWESFW